MRRIIRFTEPILASNRQSLDGGSGESVEVDCKALEVRAEARLLLESQRQPRGGSSILGHHRNVVHRLWISGWAVKP